MWCKHCGPEFPLRVEWRLEAKPLGTWSLAGAQMKIVAANTPFAICDSCGRECQGELT